MVYYLDLHDGHVKIGTTSDLVDRLRQLGARMADVLAVEFGSFALERRRHVEFAHLRRNGCERFEATGDLMQHIHGLRAQTAA